MLRTICRTSASGCPFVGVEFAATDLRRAQSVLDAVDVDLDFTFACFYGLMFEFPVPSKRQ